MGFAVELYFDDESTQTIRKMWEAIASSLLNMEASPHISLSLHEFIDVDLCKQILNRFACRYQRITVVLGTLSTFFSNEGVLFLAPVVTQPLLDLHKAFYQMLAEHGIESSEYYKPGKWIPHCTMAINLASDDLLQKFSACRELGPVQNVSLEAIGLIRYPPVHEICRYTFQV